MVVTEYAPNFPPLLLLATVAETSPGTVYNWTCGPSSVAGRAAPGWILADALLQDYYGPMVHLITYAYDNHLSVEEIRHLDLDRQFTVVGLPAVDSQVGLDIAVLEILQQPPGEPGELWNDIAQLVVSSTAGAVSTGSQRLRKAYRSAPTVSWFDWDPAVCRTDDLAARTTHARLTVTRVVRTSTTQPGNAKNIPPCTAEVVEVAAPPSTPQRRRPAVAARLASPKRHVKDDPPVSRIRSTCIAFSPDLVLYCKWHFADRVNCSMARISR